MTHEYMTSLFVYSKRLREIFDDILGVRLCLEWRPGVVPVLDRSISALASSCVSGGWVDRQWQSLTAYCYNSCPAHLKWKVHIGQCCKQSGCQNSHLSQICKIQSTDKKSSTARFPEFFFQPEVQHRVSSVQPIDVIKKYNQPIIMVMCNTRIKQDWRTQSKWKWQRGSDRKQKSSKQSKWLKPNTLQGRNKE